MKLSTRIVIVTLLVAGGTGVVYAYNKHGDWHMSHEEKVEFVTDRVSKNLELDSHQRQNFSTLAETVAQIMGDVHATKQQHIDELGELLREPGFNQARALELVQQKTRMIDEKAPQVIASLAVFLDSLDSGQKQRLQEFIEDHRHHHGHGGEH